MDSNTSFPSLTMSRWLGLAVLIPTLLQIVLAIVSIILALLWPLNAQPFDIVTGILLFSALLGLVAVSYFFLKPSVLSRSQPEQVSSLIGLVLGGILGIVVMLPGQGLNSCPGFALILLFLFIPLFFVWWLRGVPITFSEIGIPLSLSVLLLFVYGGIAWWATRRTGFLGIGLRSALLAAFLTAVSTSAIAALIRYLPLLWPPHQVTLMCFYGDGDGLPVFKYYHSFLVSTMYPLFSQMVFAFVGGLFGGLLARWLPAKTRVRSSSTNKT